MARLNFARQGVYGFTLIELLVVVAVIGILASVILVGVASFRGKGRDARRVSDIRQLQNGLELYFTSNGSYPADLATLEAAGATIGINQWPRDPSDSAKMYGFCVSGNRYTLGAALEQQNAAIRDVARITFPCQPAGMTCAQSATDLTYCVTI